jgi:RNA polymerase sigma factor (sigma-70 family)
MSIAELAQTIGYVDAVIAFGVRRLRHPDEVADLVAAVFLAVLRSAARFDPARGTARAWLYGVASNVLADGRRRGAKEAQALARVSGRRLLQPDDYADLESRLDAAALSHRLHALMADLPPGDRAVLELVALDQLTVTEAAAALGIRPVAARARLARASLLAAALLAGLLPRGAGGRMPSAAALDSVAKVAAAQPGTTVPNTSASISRR